MNGTIRSLAVLSVSDCIISNRFIIINQTLGKTKVSANTIISQTKWSLSPKYPKRLGLQIKIRSVP